MREWNARDDLELMDRAFLALRNLRRLEPGTIAVGDPLDLRGLAFPTVTLCKELELPTVVADRVAGRQEFRDAAIRRVDFSNARLDFSVWNNCWFDHVTFDGARLNNVRFFGCRFN